jgi:hypothetical protein
MRRFFFCGLAVLLFSACSTAPRGAKSGEERDEFALLPPGALVYAALDVDKSRGLLDEVLENLRSNTKTVRQFFDKTDSAALGIYPARSGRRFFIAGAGKNYPVAGIGFSLFFTSAWKKVRASGGASYWRSEKNRLSLSVQRKITVISDAEPFSPGGGVQAPDSFLLFREGAAASVWLTNINPINMALMKADIPITIPANELFITFSENSGLWACEFRLETTAPAQARALASMLTLLRNALAGKTLKDPKAADAAQMLLSSPPRIDSSALILQSPPLGQTELAGLIGSSLIYFR